MKKLDAICAKLLQGRSDGPPDTLIQDPSSVADSASNDARRFDNSSLNNDTSHFDVGDELANELFITANEAADERADSFAALKIQANSPSCTSSNADWDPNSLKNKRKNFTPRNLKIKRPYVKKAFGKRKWGKKSSTADVRNFAVLPNQKKKRHQERTSLNDGFGDDEATTNREEPKKPKQQNLADIQNNGEVDLDDEESLSAEASTVPSSPDKCNMRSNDKKSTSKSTLKSYIVRFWGPECGSSTCRALSAREHFHCKQCNYKLIPKKDEMLRHFKWQKKREESMAQGFLRFSAMDDCSIQYPDCIYSLRQTHYHCLHEDCDKVYVSTSDVQVHSNMHKKADCFAKLGFRRFRTVEDCGYEDCPFQEPQNRTTHFHCLKPGCRHSFKNKGDMDKHKTHHQRDALFCKDGFKKFMKCETCTFPGCSFSRVVNHIHCLRPGCEYIVHSTSQMYAHKRKHERHDRRGNASPNSSVNNQHRHQYKSHEANFVGKMNNEDDRLSSLDNLHNRSLTTSESDDDDRIMREKYNNDDDDDDVTDYGSQQDATDYDRKGGSSRAFANTMVPDLASPKMRSYRGEEAVEAYCRRDGVADKDASVIDMNTLQQPISFLRSVMGDDTVDDADKATEVRRVSSARTADVQRDELQLSADKAQRQRNDDKWKQFITRYTANDQCMMHCSLMYKDHYHCMAGEGCNAIFKSKDGVRDHARQHELLQAATNNFQNFDSSKPCPYPDCPLSEVEAHYHCLMPNCTEVIGSSESTFRRLEHCKLHEYANQLPQQLITSAQQQRQQIPLPIHDASRVKSISAKQSSPVTSGFRPVAPSPLSSATSATSSLRLPSANNLRWHLTASQTPRLPYASSSHHRLTYPLGDNAHAKIQYGVGPDFDYSDSHYTGNESNRHVLPMEYNGGLRRKRGRPPKESTTNAEIAQETQPHQWPSVMPFRMTGRRGRPRTVSSPRHSDLLTSSSTFEDDCCRPKMTNEMKMASKYSVHHSQNPCADDMCRFAEKLHYHCAENRCFFCTDRADYMEFHEEDFHGSFDLPSDFACYDKFYDCRARSGQCTFNGRARHFHCLLPFCEFEAFNKFNQLLEHANTALHQAKTVPMNTVTVLANRPTVGQPVRKTSSFGTLPKMAGPDSFDSCDSSRSSNDFRADQLPHRSRISDVKFDDSIKAEAQPDGPEANYPCNKSIQSSAQSSTDNKLEFSQYRRRLTRLSPNRKSEASDFSKFSPYCQPQKRKFDEDSEIPARSEPKLAKLTIRKPYKRTVGDAATDGFDSLHETS